MNQKYTSENTSINQISAPYRLKGVFHKGDRVLDYGGGKYDTATEYMASKGVKVSVYDPFNRTAEHNRSVIARFKNNPPNIIICANVLNVIAEDMIVLDVIRKIRNLAGFNTLVLFSVYEGDKSGKGKPTIKGYQRNEPAKAYFNMISHYFSDVTRKGNIFYAQR